MPANPYLIAYERAADAARDVWEAAYDGNRPATVLAASAALAAARAADALPPVFMRSDDIRVLARSAQAATLDLREALALLFAAPVHDAAALGPILAAIELLIPAAARRPAPRWAAGALGLVNA